ncbi:MAG: deoxyribose-phosphate aldolase [Candidatus Tokpelaia sp.]|nr:MAG: deoxyribose-phosphate aldolase [Candidatus Tokpelaia sp.]KAA6207152.1 MAG: deoxyribose-phosphate aldolase [Candidatus Tokpelaia sp.]
MSRNNQAAAPTGSERERQRFITGLIDLTSLRDDDTKARIAALCETLSPLYDLPAGLCIYRQFLPAADKILAAKGLRKQIRLVSVANFPAGGTDSAKAADEVKEVLALGADEVDIVFPYHALMQGEVRAGRSLLRAARAAAGGKVLKIILESGVLQQPHWIKQAAEIAVGEGADFLKTSTGKAATNATLPAARLMLEVIAEHNRNCGLKIAGGVQTQAQAEDYLALTAEILGHGWIDPLHFRFGSSVLYTALRESRGNCGVSSVDKAAAEQLTALSTTY